MPSLRSLALALLCGAAATAAAQPTTPSVPVVPTDPRITSGTAYFTFTESGALTMEILMVRQGGGGIYRVAEGTTLTELLAISGGTAPPDQTNERVIQRSIIRVLRASGGARTTVYEATPEQVLREPGRHPALADGDLVEVVTTVEERRARRGLQETLSVVTSLASVVSLVFLIARGVQ